MTTSTVGGADQAGKGATAGAAAGQPKFEPHDELHREIRRRVDEHFRTTGLQPHDVPRMYLKTAVLLTWLVASYVLLVVTAATWWQAVPCVLALGVAMPGVGFNVMHDGGHQSYSKRRWVNSLAAISADLLGGSSYVWARKHNIVHHTYTNITGWDDDIDVGVLGRLSPYQQRLWIHRFQHWYIWPLYGLIPFKWYFVDDFRDVLRGRIGRYRIARPRGLDLAVFLGGKALFFYLAFVVPLSRHPVWAVVLCYLGVSMIEGVVLAVVFQLAHCVGEASFLTPDPRTGRMDSHWAAHQVETTVDFARGNRFVTWFVGGLNYQIEHHLLPHVCHVHYPALAGLVEATCREFGVRYVARQTFSAAVVAHFRWLRQMGLAAES